jgi:transposase
VSRFPTAEQLASWCGVCPGNNESAGKQRSGAIAPGDRPVRKALGHAAWAASHTKGSYVQALYHRIAARRGKQRAIVAVAHSIAISGWHMLTKNEPYREPAATSLSEKQKANALKRSVKKLKSLGYEVELRPVASMAPMGSG